jgi:hypothetical protein
MKPKVFRFKYVLTPIIVGLRDLHSGNLAVSKPTQGHANEIGVPDEPVAARAPQHFVNRPE